MSRVGGCTFRRCGVEGAGGGGPHVYLKHMVGVGGSPEPTHHTAFFQLEFQALCVHIL